MLTAKLLVPLGAPFQLKAGETLPPAQPKPLNTCSLTMVSPSLRSELVKVMFCAIAALEPSTPTPSAAIQRANFAIKFLPLRHAGIPGCSRAGAGITTLGIVWKLKRDPEACGRKSDIALRHVRFAPKAPL